MLASCVIKTLLSAKTTDPLKLIPIVIDAVISFYEGDKDGNKLAIDHAEYLATFMLSMNAEKVPPIKFVLRPGDDVLQKYTEERKKQCLKIQRVAFSQDSTSLDGSSNTEDPKDVLKQLTDIIASQVESTKQSNRISKLEYKRNKEKIIT